MDTEYDWFVMSKEAEWEVDEARLLEGFGSRPDMAFLSANWGGQGAMLCRCRKGRSETLEAVEPIP
jgi:hypothetical protein